MASIKKRTTKSGEARYDLRYRVGRRTATKTFRRRADADARRREVEHGELRGLVVDPRGGRITLGEWWERWWPSALHLRASTRARDESYWRSRIEPTFGEVRLDQIDRESLRDWIAELKAARLAPATIQKAVQILGKAIRAAVDDGRLARSPVERLDLPKIEREEMRFLGPAQVETLAEAITPRYRGLVYLGAYGGLRLGEMLALRRSNVDLLHRQVEVVATLAEVHGQLVENPPKTRAGRRKVPLPRVVSDELERHLASYANGETDGHLFTAPEGGPVRASSWRRRSWHPATASVCLEGLRPHDLRHTAVALWIAAGASPREIASRAGHSSVVTVLDRYGHLLPGGEDKVNDALDELAKGVTGAGRSRTG